MAERTIILIDGSNFFHRLRELKLSHLIHFDYKNFTSLLCGKNQTIWTRYYIGRIRAAANDEKRRQLMGKQQQLFQNLRKSGWEISCGYMLKSEDQYHEKGVDVLMAVDLISGAYENEFDTAILVSSDTDLIPALKKVRKLGKKIIYVGFGHKPSYAMIAHSDIRRLLQKEELKQFLPPQEE